MQIQDGSGSGFSAKVDSHKRLHVDSVTFGRSEQEAELGNAYNINTGVINLSAVADSAVLYVENTGDEDLVVGGLFYNLGTSDVSGDILVTVIRNPTAGTCISDATAADMPGVNRNFGSSKTLPALVYKGAEGKTFTDGDDVIQSIVQAPSRTVIVVGDIIVPKGSAIGVKVKPFTSNTDMDIEIELNCFVDTLKDVT